nr:MAG TPA: HTH-type transcriptional regulator [Caudoviricetes sp.]
MGKVICTKCKKFVDYSIEYKQEKTTIKGKEIAYLRAEAHCKECGAIIWAEEIEERNIRTLELKSFKEQER